jgi:hypothetical protein
MGIEDKEIESAITLIPSSVIVCEALFSKHKNDVELLRSTKDIDLNTILYRLSGYGLFDICVMIAKKWEMDPKIELIIKASSGDASSKLDGDIEEVKFGKWIHLLFFYIVSKPQYIDAGLNDFLEFDVEYVDDIYEEFMEIMEIES